MSFDTIFLFLLFFFVDFLFRFLFLVLQFKPSEISPYFYRVLQETWKYCTRR